MDTKEQRRLNILTKPILPLLVKTAIPTIIGMLISIIYNLTDTFFVGRLHNSAMIAAIGVVFSFTGIMQALGFWFGYGSGNAMAKNIGAQQAFLLYRWQSTSAAMPRTMYSSSPCSIYELSSSAFRSVYMQ